MGVSVLSSDRRDALGVLHGAQQADRCIGTPASASKLEVKPPRMVTTGAPPPSACAQRRDEGLRQTFDIASREGPFADDHAPIERGRDDIERELTV